MIIVILLTFITAIGLSSILIYINTLLAKKRIQEREKPSAFECGFDPKRSSRLPFSLRFYLIAVIFLIFDVEITLIIPLPTIISQTNITPITTITLFFIIILVVGLYHE
jgi:NADH-ubiquinone oxidoreductase chain 3